MLKYLLDTNIVIYVIKQRPLAVVEDFVSRLDVLAYDDKAAWQYGNIRNYVAAAQSLQMMRD